MNAIVNACYDFISSSNLTGTLLGFMFDRIEEKQNVALNISNSNTVGLPADQRLCQTTQIDTSFLFVLFVCFLASDLFNALLLPYYTQYN